MSALPIVLVIIAVVLILAGRLRKRWPVAAAGYALLAVAGLLVLLTGRLR